METTNTSDILPRRDRPFISNRESIKAKTIIHIAGRNGGILDGGEDLPVTVLGAGHEARGTLARVGVVGEAKAGLVLEGAEGGAWWDVG